MKKLTGNDGDNRAPHDELRVVLQELVNLVGIDWGVLGITVHENMAMKVEITPVVMIGFNPRHRRRMIGVEAVAVRVAGVETFVRSRLEPLILARVGGFGRVEVAVEAGSIAMFEYRTKIKGGPEKVEIE